MGPFSSSCSNLFSEIIGLGRSFATTLPRGGACLRWNHLRQHPTGAMTTGCQVPFRNRDDDFFIFVVSVYHIALCSEHDEALCWMLLLKAHSSSAWEEVDKHLRNTQQGTVTRSNAIWRHFPYVHLNSQRARKLISSPTFLELRYIYSEDKP